MRYHRASLEDAVVNWSCVVETEQGERGYRAMRREREKKLCVLF